MKEDINSESTEHVEGKGRNLLVKNLLGWSLVGVIIAGTLTAVAQGISLSEQIRSEKFAVEVLQAEMDHLRTMEWSQIEQLPTRSSFDPTLKFADSPLRDFAAERIITPRGNSQKEIRLILKWNGSRKGTANKREFVSYFSRKGEYHPVISPAT